MPAGFWWSFAGAVGGGGVAMWLVAATLRRGLLRARLRRLAADARASSIVEVPFALIGLVLLTLGVAQLTFLCAGYVMVDYAAWCAARSASVVIPTNRMTHGTLLGSADDDTKSGASEGGSGAEWAVPDVLYRIVGGPAEPSGTIAETSISYDTFTRKGQDVRGAAVLAIYPVAGLADVTNPAFGGGVSAGEWAYDVAFTIPGLDKVTSFLNRSTFVRRWVYADTFTSARLFPAKTTWAGGDVVSVEVVHEFHLALPFADRLLRHGVNAGGSFVRLAARHACVVEGYVELPPPDAPEETAS
jgi:hypothetical protein